MIFVKGRRTFFIPADDRCRLAHPASKYGCTSRAYVELVSPLLIHVYLLSSFWVYLLDRILKSTLIRTDCSYSECAQEGSLTGFLGPHEGKRANYYALTSVDSI